MERRTFVVSLAGSLLLIGASFLPWLRLGDVGLAGVPDPAGFFVLGVGAAGALLAAGGLVARRDTQPILVLVGLAGLTTLMVVFFSGPATIADRAHARAEAVALVDNVAPQPVPPVHVGFGLIVGLLGAAAVTTAGLRSVWSRET